MRPGIDHIWWVTLHNINIYVLGLPLLFREMWFINCSCIYSHTPAQLLKVHAYIVLIKSTFLSEPHNQGVVTYIPVLKCLQPESKWNQANQSSFLSAGQGINVTSKLH